jgi:transposase
MAISYRPHEPQQEMLLPASLQDWLPKGHLAYFISDTIDALDLGAFCARYAGGGARNQPFHPAMMVKVLVCGYATGVFSSRKIERRLHEDLAFRMLGAGNFPKHRTIRDFRALHLKELADRIVQVVKLARGMELVKLGTVAGLLAALGTQPWLQAWCGALGGELGAAFPVQPPAGFGTYEAGSALAASLAGPGLWADLLGAALVVHVFAVCSAALAGAFATLFLRGPQPPATLTAHP